MRASPLRSTLLGLGWLLLTVPLPFLAGTGPLGLPLWALVSLAATAAFAITAWWLLGHRFGAPPTTDDPAATPEAPTPERDG